FHFLLGFQNVDALPQFMNLCLGYTFLGLQPSGDDFSRSLYDNNNSEKLKESHNGLLTSMSLTTSYTSVIHLRPYCMCIGEPLWRHGIQIGKYAAEHTRPGCCAAEM